MNQKDSITPTQYIRNMLEMHGTPDTLIVDWETFDEVLAVASKIFEDEVKKAHLLGLVRTAHQDLDEETQDYYDAKYGSSKEQVKKDGGSS